VPLWLVSTLVGLLVARTVESQESSSWLGGNRITLKVSAPGEADSAVYGLLIAANGDIQINIDTHSAKDTTSGVILLISGRVMATQGLKLDPGFEIDAADAAGLSWQLASQLLERGFAGDPRNLKQSVQINVAEKELPINVGTTSASATYPPPWTARGTVQPAGGGRVAFDITFGIRAPGPPPRQFEFRYSGTWERAQPPPVIDDTRSLKNWTIHRIGPTHRSDAGGQIFDYGASPTQDKYATVGDLRKSVAKAAKAEKEKK
jgi:hypothetical protein